MNPFKRVYQAIVGYRARHKSRWEPNSQIPQNPRDLAEYFLHEGEPIGIGGPTEIPGGLEGDIEEGNGQLAKDFGVEPEEFNGVDQEAIKRFRRSQE